VQPIGQGLSNSLYFVRRLTPSSGAMFAVTFDRRRSKDLGAIEGDIGGGETPKHQQPSPDVVVLRKFGHDMSIFIDTAIERFVFRILSDRGNVPC